MVPAAGSREAAGAVGVGRWDRVMAGGAVLQTGSRWNLMAFRTRQMWKLVPTDICGSDLGPDHA
jgi:hypothetical protein